MGDLRCVGPWRLERELGRGSYGVVFLARREDGGPPAALKLLLSHDPEALARLEREGALAARLSDHPGIVPVIDAGLSGGRPFLAMEWVDGPTLATRLARRPLSPDQAVRCLLAIARAMEHAHGLGVVHRDLKPANVLLAGDDPARPRVTDFGLARIDEGRRLTRSGDVVGTLAYMAPEQLEGRRDLDARVDVWALGAMLHEALGGRPPFLCQRLDQLAALHRAGAPPLPAGLPPPLLAAVRRALAFDREERFPSGGAFADALEAALLPAPRALPARTWPGRAWIAGGLAVLLVGVGLAALLLAGGAERPAVEPVAAPPAAEELPRPDPLERARAGIEAARAALDAARDAAREPGREGYEEGLARFDEAVRLAAESGDAALQVETRLDRARYRFRRARFATAAAEAQELSREPGRAGLEARFLEALVGLWDDQDPRDGLERLERLWRDDPDGPVGLSAGGTFSSYGGRNQEGEALTRRALELDPGWVEPMIGRAFCLNDLSRRDEALAMVEQALDRAPDHLRGWLCLSMVRLNRAEPELAREAAERFLLLSEGAEPPPRGVSFLIEACAGTGDHARVIEAATGLIARDQATAREWVRRAQAYELTDDLVRADHDWRVLSRHPAILQQALDELPPRVADRVRDRLRGR